ncbi:glycosyltransferase [Thioalkalivibrio sp. ALJ15]|uniref:glycosyltransferase n=1 Tax=Thioalkalivibrio sp. ALJ15 TaxID=748652 RepID=UPI000A05BFC1|nr:glycosyltransferase [Thioalkalivibrio sp. ALJ15]
MNVKPPQAPLIVIFGSFRDHGAIQDTLEKMIDKWVQWGCKVEIVSFREGEGFYSGPYPIQHVHLKVRHRITATIGLWVYLRRKKPAAAMACTHIANTILASTRSLPGKSPKIVLGIHQNYADSKKNDSRPLKQKNKIREIKKHYPSAHGVITVSHGIRESLEKKHQTEGINFKTIYNGILTDKIHELATQNPNHSWLQEEKSGPVIVTAGRLTEQKDQKTLLEAFKIVLHRAPSARLIILGEGNQRAELEELARHLKISQEVDMPGHKENPYPYMERADVFALSSRWEGLGNVLIEALALSTPVVATDCPSGPREILADGCYGTLVPPGKPEALAEGLLKVLQGNAPQFDRNEAIEKFRAEYAAREYLNFMGITPPNSRPWTPE